MQSEMVKFKRIPELFKRSNKKICLAMGYFNDGRWKADNMEEVSPFIDKWNISSLFVHKNKEALILKQISHIGFSSLICLDVRTNQIQTIEGIDKINMPILSQIYLDGNILISLKLLKKVNWPKLQNLYLNELYNQTSQQNCYIDPEKLVLANFKLLKDICLHFYDVRWMLKLGMGTLRDLQIETPKLVKNAKIDQILTKKWKNIDLQ